jgi:MFS family permease
MTKSAKQGTRSGAGDVGSGSVSGVPPDPGAATHPAGAAEPTEPTEAVDPAGLAEAAETAEPGARWRLLALLAVVQLLGMSLWFTASATAAQLALLWDMDPAAAGRLTTAVQIGFVAGTAVAALLNLADLVPARTYVAVSAVLAALANGSLVLAGGPGTALVSRFLTGFFLAGVYPPAMKMAATWFRTSRGLAIGAIVGALTIGKALPYLIGAFAEVGWRFVALSTSAGALLAAVLVATAYRDGPFPFPRRRFELGLVGTILRHRESRLAIGGYLGHMWELYAMWAALSLFFLDFYQAKGYPLAGAAMLAGMTTFAAISAGGIGSILAGVWADRVGRENIAAAALALSATCALAIGWLGAAPTVLVVSAALVWGFAVVADSAQFSALVTDVAPPHAVGTALTLQTSLGFLLSAGTMWLTFEVQQAFGWGPAFALLALGPIVGIGQMMRLKTVRIGGRMGK